MSRHKLEPNETTHVKAVVFMDRGLALHRLGDHADSLKCFDAAIDAEPNLANAHYGKGFALSVLERHDEAVPCFEEALKLDPDFAAAYYEKGCSLSRLRKYDAAAECLGKATRLNPDYVMAHYEKGLRWPGSKDTTRPYGATTRP